MRIPEDLIIPDAKITGYLLVPKPRNDKSKFLVQAGFTLENPEALKLAIQTQALSTEAVEEKINEYGTFYQVEADLIGVNGKWYDPDSYYRLARKTDRWQISIRDT